MEISDVIEVLGNPGKFQSVLYFIVWVCNSTVAMNHLIMAVFGATSPHSCSLPPSVLKNESVPFKIMEGTRIYNSCYVYKNFNSSSGQHVSCPNGWDFKHESRESSIGSEWNLVCDKKYLTSLATTIYFIGVMVGGILFGTISDKFGRRPVMLGTLYTHVIVGFCIAFIPNYAGFVALRFLLGMLMQGLQSSSYLLMIEYCRMEHRPTVGGLWGVFWAVGTISMACLAWAIKNWRHIQLALCLPSVITIIYFWIVPESMRWLVTHDKHDKALNIAIKIARINKTKLPENLEISVKTSFGDKSPSDYNIFDLFKTPVIRKRALLMFYVWLVSSLGYYGLSFNAAGMTKNKYLSIFISSMVELPCYPMIIYVLRRFGRRRPLLLFYLVGGASCVIAGSVPSKTVMLQWERVHFGQE